MISYIKLFLTHVKRIGMMNKMIKLVIFDLDGTLINSIYDLADAVNDSLIKMGYPVHNVDKYYHFVGNGTVKLSERALPEEHRSETEIKKLHALFSEKYQKCCLNKTRPYDGILDVIYKLKTELGVKCAVASNKTDSFAKYIVNNLFKHDFFDAVIGKRDNVPAKPDPQIIYNIVNKFEVRTSEVIVVGDSDVDVLTAHNGNICCIGCEWGFRGKEELQNAGADFLAEKPKDIFDIIYNLQND